MVDRWSLYNWHQPRGIMLILPVGTTSRAAMCHRKGPLQNIRGDQLSSHLSMNDHLQSNPSNDIEFLDIRRSTVEEDPQRIPIYSTRGDTRLSYKRVWLSSSKVSLLILLGETLSNSSLRFPFPNRHWLKHWSKSHRVSHSGLCFASLHTETDQPLQDTFDPHLSLHCYHDRNNHQQYKSIIEK